MNNTTNNQAEQKPISLELESGKLKALREIDGQRIFYNEEQTELLLKEFSELVDLVGLKNVAFILDRWLSAKIAYENEECTISYTEFYCMRLVRNFFFKLSDPIYFKDLD